MAMPEKKNVSPAKAAVVEEMKEKLQSAQGAVLVGFTGFNCGRRYKTSSQIPRR